MPALTAETGYANPRFVLSSTAYEAGTARAINKNETYKAEAYMLATTKIINLAKTDTTNLAYDGTSDNNLRYIGKDPNNYVKFNDELWRIIGVMNNIDDGTGKKETRIKLIRNESIGKYCWDSSKVDINSGFGISQWGESTYEDGTSYEGADIMRELNNDYLGNITVGTDGMWYYSSYESKDTMPSIKLSEEAQKMISNVKWNLGSFIQVKERDNWHEKGTPSVFYSKERGSDTGKVCPTNEWCNDKVIRTTSWIGKVGLMYPSDYGFSTSGGNSSNLNTCLSTSMNKWDSNENCYKNSWIYKKDYTWQWTIMPGGNIILSSTGFYVSSNLAVTTGGGDANLFVHGQIRPTVYLLSQIYVSGGDGSQSNPYTLKLF